MEVELGELERLVGLPLDRSLEPVNFFEDTQVTERSPGAGRLLRDFYLVCR